MIGAYSAGLLGGAYPKRLLLSGIYLGRAIAFALFVLVPASTLTVLVFAAALGLLWLSTVPLTSGLVALMFGTRHVGMLFGVVFLSHQVGAFVGVWLGGAVYERTGAYDLMWVLCIVLSVFAAAVHLPDPRAPRAPSGAEPRMSRRVRDLLARRGAHGSSRSPAWPGRRAPPRPTARTGSCRR